jgi:glucokinase
MQILAGDIGGTHTRLTLFHALSHDRLEPLREATYPSSAYTGLEAILSQFFEGYDLEQIERACFGIAGPVIDQACDTTNLPWRVSANAIQQAFDFDATWLLNDLEANAWGIESLSQKDLLQLNAGKPHAGGNRSIISAGTGLGEAGLYWDGSRYRPFPSEGGHADFSPSNLLEYELMEWLAEQHGHVSWERVVSGPGLENIYQFLLSYHQLSIPNWLQAERERLGMAPAISAAALSGRDPLCVESLDLFIDCYAREAGNQALKLMSAGGVYLGGGIAPRISPRLSEGAFLQAFVRKGRMQPLMEAMPLYVILNDKTALMGTARFAALH